MVTDYSVYELTCKERIRFYLIGGVCLFIVGMLFYKSIIFSTAISLSVIFFENEYCIYLAGKRKDELSLQFRDLLYSLSSSIAAGRQMGEALIEANDILAIIYDDNAPMMRELRTIKNGILENHISEEAMLFSLAERSNIEDIRDFAEVYKVCRTTGSDLERVIRNSTEILMDKIDIEREIKALTAQKQFEGKMITVMPLGVILFLDMFSPDYLDVMYQTAAGRTIMTLCLAGMVSAFILTERLLRIEV